MIAPKEGPSCIIKGVGAYAPERVLSNDDLSAMVDTSDEWIRTRTGIRERRIASEREATSDLATEAGRRAIEQAGLSPQEIDLVLVATVTPDMAFPSTACLVQGKLGLRHVPAFDIEAACSGFLYGLEMATSMVNSGAYQNVLLIGAEKLSTIVDWTDRTTCVLFGDGAGACVVGVSDDPGFGILGTSLGANGSEADLLKVPAGGSRTPLTAENVGSRLHAIQMQGREVFKSAVRVMEQAALDQLAANGVRSDEVAWVVPHQANIRIIESLSERLRLPMSKFAVNLERFGNTSSASIPIALDEAVRDGRIQHGDYLLMVGFGGGLTWGASLVKWYQK